MKRFVLPLLLTLTLILAACAPSQASTDSPSGTSLPIPQLATASPTKSAPQPANDANASADLTRSDQHGSVSIEITPLNLSAPADQLEFDVALSTHSVDLSMDLATLSTLTTDTGLTVQSTLWDAPRGGHHVNGKLIFPSKQDSKSILDGASKLTLTITNLDAPSRVFEWDLK
jgi:hypothetical protein